MDKILRIDMGAEGGPKTAEEPLGEYDGLGGSALTSAMISKEVDPLLVNFFKSYCSRRGY